MVQKLAEQSETQGQFDVDTLINLAITFMIVWVILVAIVMALRVFRRDHFDSLTRYRRRRLQRDHRQNARRGGS